MSSYVMIGETSKRTIPQDWPAKPVHVGRSDASADMLTDPDCRFVEYTKTNCWRVRISTSEMCRALAAHEWRGHGWMLKPFWIDMNARTVNGVQVQMDVLWRAALPTGQATIDSSSLL